MPRRNRVDPWGDLYAVRARGMFTGNRGCLVDNSGHLTRHHNGSLWITCVLEYRDWQHPLDAPRTWTPLFFLDDAVALAAGHRPCGLCRRDDYLSYRDAVAGVRSSRPVLLASDLNRALQGERLTPGRGLVRANDRITWTAPIDSLPSGVVIVDSMGDDPLLVSGGHLQTFTFAGWGDPVPRPTGVPVTVLTPPLSAAALRNGFVPRLHATAMGA